MRRLMCSLACVVFLPVGAAAQVTPAAPAAPSRAPVAPVPPMPSPVPLPSPEPHPQDFSVLESRMEEIQLELSAKEARLLAEQEHLVEQQLAGLHANLALHLEPFGAQGPAIAGQPANPANLYNLGLNALQRRQYDRAVQMFDRVIAAKGTHADGATYWKAFSEARLARTDDALGTLAALRRDYPQSRYASEAKVLEAEVRRMTGQRIDPQTLDANDELQLIAINGIANTDPDRAIPLLEGVLTAANSLGIKRRALFVLALNQDLRAHQILLRYAKGGGSPELQAEAIRHLVSRRDGRTTAAELREIYASAEDIAVRRAVIDAYGGAGDKLALLAIVRDKVETADVRRSAINRLSGLAEPAELAALYRQEQDAGLRMQMINVLASIGAVGELVEAVKIEKVPAVRVRALRSLGEQPAERTGPMLVDFYPREAEGEARRAIISALRHQGDAESLVSLARKETSLELRRDIVSALSALAATNRVAADYLVEMIK